MDMSDRPSGKYDLQGSPGQDIRNLCEDAARIVNEIHQTITIQHNQTRIAVWPDDTPLDVMERFVQKRDKE